MMWPKGDGRVWGAKAAYAAIYPNSKRWFLVAGSMDALQRRSNSPSEWRKLRGGVRAYHCIRMAIWMWIWFLKSKVAGLSRVTAFAFA
jgi:hypothetical protein